MKTEKTPTTNKCEGPFSQKPYRHNLSAEKFKEFAPELNYWLDKYLSRSGGIAKNAVFQQYSNEPERISVNLYTENHNYKIAVKPGMQNEANKYTRGYLGCIVTNRKCCVGEDWHRSGDLADGDYSEKTFSAIMRDIVATEVKRVAPSYV